MLCGGRQPFATARSDIPACSRHAPLILCRNSPAQVAMCEKLNIRPPSKVTLKIQWIPYTYAEHESGGAGSDKKHKHHKCAACFPRRGCKARGSREQRLTVCLREFDHRAECFNMLVWLPLSIHYRLCTSDIAPCDALVSLAGLLLLIHSR